MFRLEPVRAAHLEALLAFERENRAYFARTVSDRGDAYFAAFADHHRALLLEQASGQRAFHVLTDSDGGPILGRFNLYEIRHGSAEVGYRVAEAAAGQGVATQGLLQLCAVARDRHGLHTLRAGTSSTNLASQRVLLKAGFLPAGQDTVAGRPGPRFRLDLARDPGVARDTEVRPRP